MRPASITRRSLPRDVWLLGTVSLLMDASSELAHSLLPVLLVSGLGASVLSVGLVEGVAEGTSSFVKVFSGTLSDRWRRRKPLVVLGYGLAALAKPALPLASSVAWVFAARFVDRVGKGIRGAPRDALLADVTPEHMRGAAYGLRQSLDSVGAVIGPTLAIALMSVFANNIRTALWFATVPAVCSVSLLALAVREPERSAHDGRPPVALSEMRHLPPRYWAVVAFGLVFTLARFSDAFLVLRASDVGLSPGHAPVVMVAMSVVYALGAYPAGALSDRIGTRGLLIAGLLVLVLADGVLATAATAVAVVMGAACWGLHMALTQGLFSKLVADAATTRLRGTAFGVFNLATGVATLVASVLAGVLWQRLGPAATFWASAAFAAVTAMGVMRLHRDA